MTIQRIILVIFILSTIGCKGPISKIFKPHQTAHEAYADNLKNDSLGKAWLTVSKNSLQQALAVSLPYRQKGHFPNDKLRAITLVFTAVKGERLTFQLKSTDSSMGIIFADLFNKETATFTHLIATDTNLGIINYDVKENGNYFLRLQPQIKAIENYELQISKGPSLAFPVAGNRSIWSVWGDARDAGARSHEGIDIGAPRGTPALAAAAGVVSRVQESGIGGKTVSIRTNENNLSLYYAHLDTQLVQEGRRVSAGDTIGLVGNTGNAITTGPHLHFGIYGFGGAIDPLPFVNKKIAAAPSLPVEKFPKKLELLKPFTINENAKLAVKSILIPLAINNEGYFAETTEGIIIKVPVKTVRKL